MAAPLALYRRYRPETFGEMVGQEHVTGPLMAALKNDRVSHAYLFSGPRGCGKTTSARVLARSLICVEGPTPTPCGECEPCVALARGGPGHIDVIEIDAASHGGVDDARDLRERAFFSPVQARYKVYIVDEAHMVSAQGFNALLKLVEEPPEHVKFIFATTEPDKVIGTIRSRTHHYPFRLVPPKIMTDFLTGVCGMERIEVEAGVLPLVVRAGGGAFRDSLSVLDQLMAAAEAGSIGYPAAVSLLGYTPETLLDEVVDALAAYDGAGVFAVVDKVVESGQDPRRFAEDLLHRLRDLVIVAADPEAASSGLVQVAPEVAERLDSQAARLGGVQATRAAETVNDGLLLMRGAVAPRLQLELICARLLLPAADDSTLGFAARLERIEQRLAGGEVPPAPRRPDRPVTTAQPTPEPDEAAAVQPPRPEGTRPDPPTDPVRQDEPTTKGPRAEPTASSQPAAKKAHEQPAPAEKPEDLPGWGPPAQPGAPAADSSPADRPTDAAGAPVLAGGLDVTDVRRLWPEVLDNVKSRKRMTWMILSQSAQVLDVTGGVLTLGVEKAGTRTGFLNSGSDEVLRQALLDVFRADFRVETVLDPTAVPEDRAAAPTKRDPFDARRGSGSDQGSETATPTDGPAATPTGPGSRPAGAGPSDAVTPPPADHRSGPADEDGAGVPSPQPMRGRALADAARQGGPSAKTNPDEAVDIAGDPVTDAGGETQSDLLARELGATVIDEYTEN